MCLLCVEIQKQNMTVDELAKAYHEFDVPSDHEDEISDVIRENYDIFEVVDKLLDLYKED